MAVNFLTPVSNNYIIIFTICWGFKKTTYSRIQSNATFFFLSVFSSFFLSNLHIFKDKKMKGGGRKTKGVLKHKWIFFVTFVRFHREMATLHNHVKNSGLLTCLYTESGSNVFFLVHVIWNRSVFFSCLKPKQHFYFSTFSKKITLGFFFQLFGILAVQSQQFH